MSTADGAASAGLDAGSSRWPCTPVRGDISAFQEALRDVLSKGNAAAGEPPLKRRRISESLRAENDVEAPQSVILAECQIKLDLGEHHQSWVQEFDVPVTLDVRLQFTSPNHHGPEETGGTQSKQVQMNVGRHKLPAYFDTRTLPPPTLECLSHACKLKPLPRKGETSTKSSLAWSDCSLNIEVHGQATEFTLLIRIRWAIDALASDVNSPYLNGLLNTYLPNKHPQELHTWSPQDFYENAFVPPESASLHEEAPLDSLKCQLYPFQKRAVAWLLRREKIQFNPDGQLTPAIEDLSVLPSLFEKGTDAEGQLCYVSHLLGEVCKRPTSSRSSIAQLRGGILAEEMGLGKTVELIALFLLHTRPDEQRYILDTYTNAEVITSAATLIITPPAILQQWKNELNSHAPSLRVYEYKGATHLSHDQTEALRNDLLDQDIVLTTYGVLAREVHFAEEKPNRNFRHEKKYVPRRSPLMQLQWWRVCLDEAQMVESGVSNAATVARLLPRCNAWAVSGTPLRKDVKDLLGLLIFLRYEPFCDRRVWKRLIEWHQRIFSELFQTIALRHTKSKIRDELRLPPQKRIVITVPFTPIEEQHYGQVFQLMCEDCGLDKTGAPLQADWDPHSARTIEKMRSWLARLRQTCLHPEVGSKNRRALGGRDGPLRTVDEVLQVMIDQNETALRTEERAVVLSQILRAHVILYGKQSERALGIYLAVEPQIEAIVAECREQLAAEKEKLKSSVDNNHGSVKIDDSSDEEGADNEDKKRTLGIFQQRLRSALEVQHTCIFLTANAYYEHKTRSGHAEESREFQDLEKLETQYYEKAKQVRQELLQDVSKKSERLMKAVSEKRDGSAAVDIPIVPEFNHLRGIESRKVVDTIEDLEDFLNAQTAQYKLWRRKMSDLLTARLLDEDSGIEMTGDEYETSTKQQDEQYVYLDALRCLIADRHCLMTGQRNELINHEMKEAFKLAKEDLGHAPELVKEIVAIRQKLLPKGDISVRSIISDIRSMITSIRWQENERTNRATAEAKILEQEMERLQKLLIAHTKTQTALEKEVDLYRSTMNQRLEFYRQLQQISDAVAPLQEEMDEQVDEARVATEAQKEREHATKLAKLLTKRRFLQHLKADSSGDDQRRICVICQCHFEVGMLTVCGHQYCKDCIKQWWAQHRNCPMCKRQLKISDFHAITYKPMELQAHEESPATTANATDSTTPEVGSPVRSSKSSIYSDIGDSTLSEIKSFDLNGSFGTKIDTLARHLLWIREHDPGAKSIIFSQYRDFLQVLARALRHFKIGCTAITTKGSIAEFQTDPSIECFLLHAKADSSGLNLVNATHVFLCEPLINTAIELQAIARVHRIGQRRPTTVWMYLVSDTVEEAIYDTSVTRRLAHIRRVDSNDAAPRAATRTTSRSGTATPNPHHLEEMTLDAANSLELQQAPLSTLMTKGQSGGEVVAQDDLWHCLFHKPGGRDKPSTALDSRDLELEVNRHLRAEAAELRIAGADTGSE